MECSNKEKNKKKCTCTYGGCDKKGNCCACLQYHLKNRELPGCCFPPESERSYDRSFENFIKSVQIK
ncbi:MAG: cytosolic protein [Oligoflexia bacterium]|nr:cytosolic protein [Oligoflexia bacterium]